MALTVRKIIDLAVGSIGTRYLLTRTQILAYLNIIQSIAYDKDQDYFTNYDTYIKIYKEITLVSETAVDSDVGKEVVGTTSAATGTLISYNPDTLAWVIDPVSGDFLEGETLTITSGTGTGDISSIAVFRGPYAAPSDCRKFIGVTSLTNAQLFGGDPVYSTDNYGTRPMIPSRIRVEKYKYENIFYDQYTQEVSFLSDPVETANFYRYLYYFNPPEITAETGSGSDENLVIPENQKYSLLVGGIAVLANNAIYGDSPVVAQQLLAPYLNAFWRSVSKNNQDTPGFNSDALGLM